MRVLLHLFAFVVGAAVSVAVVTTHRSVMVSLPFGLLLGLAATFVVAWAMRETLRRLATSFAVGWIVVFGFVIVGKPEGDFAVASDLRGYALMAAAMVLAAVGVASFTPPSSSLRTGST